jgi:predicted porin
MLRVPLKQSLIAAAVLACAASSAFAQSSVTVYGRLNLTIERQTVGSGSSNWTLQNNASRFGLRGSEDLGGGMKAGFGLEAGFNPALGSSTTPFWGRQSEVNLSGGFGMLRLGNFLSEAYFATADYVSLHNHDTGTSSDALYAYIGRNTSKVAWRSPNFGGSTFEAAITEGGTLNRTTDLAWNYSAGALTLGAGYEDNSPTNKKAKQFAVRGLYELGSFTLGGYVQRDTDGYGAGLGSRTTLRLVGMHAMGPHEVHLNVGRAGKYSNGLNGGPGDSANQYTLGYNHKLSKRTKVYGFVTKVADNGTTYGDFRSLALGVRHNF